MRGLLRIGRSLALRHLPRLGASDGSRGFLPLPGFCGRPAGDGPAAGIACGAFAMHLATSFLCRWLAALGCRQATVPARGGVTSPRPESRVQRRDPCGRPKAPTGAAFSRTALRALPSALVGVQPTTVPGVPSRDAGKAAASSRPALPSRRASVVSTVSASERVETTLGNIRRRNCKSLNKGGLWTSDALKGSFWARNARKRGVQNDQCELFPLIPSPPGSSLGLRGIPSVFRLSGQGGLSQTSPSRTELVCPQ